MAENQKKFRSIFNYAPILNKETQVAAEMNAIVTKKGLTFGSSSKDVRYAHGSVRVSNIKGSLDKLTEKLGCEEVFTMDNTNGNDNVTNVINLVAFGNTAELLEKAKVAGGDYVHFFGVFQSNENTDKEGKKHKVPQFVVYGFEVKKRHESKTEDSDAVTETVTEEKELVETVSEPETSNFINDDDFGDVDWLNNM